jgi:ER-bound oxygenase mpaB/B'/Rubber oxygenase, catalytic domain
MVPQRRSPDRAPRPPSGLTTLQGRPRSARRNLKNTDGADTVGGNGTPIVKTPAVGTKCKICNIVSVTEVSHIAPHADALPLGPQSRVWRYFGDNRMFLIGPRPAVLQNMLAELGQGVLDHSVFFSDTAARVKRSLPPIFMTV